MRSTPLLILSAAILSLTVFLIWFFFVPRPPPPPPHIESVTIEPSLTCPGGSVTYRAIAFDSDSWTIRERSGSDEREVDTGETDAAIRGIANLVWVCPPSELCLELVSDRGTVEECVSVAFREGAWRHELTFQPECPELSYPQIQIIDAEDEGNRVVLTARNASTDIITLSHKDWDATVAREVARPGASYSRFAGRTLHGTWSIERVRSSSTLVEECPPPDAPLDLEPPAGVAWIPPITIELGVQCNSVAAECP